MIKAAVLGCGRIASDFDSDPKRKYVSTHIGAYKKASGIKLEAICEIDKEKLKKCLDKWRLKKGYTNLKEMLKNERIDILSICTPPKTHLSVLKEAIKFPLKAIFCEKPLADNLNDAMKMVNLCRKRGIILQVNHQRRFDPMHRKIKNIIESKNLGELEQANFYYTAGIKNTGSHMFDLMRFLFGESEWVEAIYSKNESLNIKDPNIDGMIKYKNGLLATFQACDVKKYLIFELNCLFEKGRIVLKNSGFSADFHKTGKSKYFSGYIELLPGKAPFKTDYKRNFMVNAVTHLAECVKRKKDSISSGSDGAAVLRLIDAAIKSADNDGKKMYTNRRKK